jgi:hypothetical protein
MPEGAVYVGRPTRWGNPYRAGVTMNVRSVESAVALFREVVAPTLDVAPLRGRDLVCWCPLDQPCHADVLLEIANGVVPLTREEDA